MISVLPVSECHFELRINLLNSKVGVHVMMGMFVPIVAYFYIILMDIQIEYQIKNECNN